MQIIRFPFDPLSQNDPIADEAEKSLHPKPANDTEGAPPEEMTEGAEPGAEGVESVQGAEFIEMPEVIRLTEEDAKAREAAAFEKGKAEGYEAGLAAGKGERLEADQRLADTIEALRMVLVGAEEQFDQSVTGIKRQLLQVSGDIAMKLASRALRERPDEAVLAMLEQVIPHIIQQPAIKIFVHPDMADSLQEKIISLSSGASLAGRCSVHPSAELAPGDCRVEWVNGSAQMDHKALADRLRAIIEEYE